MSSLMVTTSTVSEESLAMDFAAIIRNQSSLCNQYSLPCANHIMNDRISLSSRYGYAFGLAYCILEGTDILCVWFNRHIIIMVTGQWHDDDDVTVVQQSADPDFGAK